MEPIGLTTKTTRKKYDPVYGELMVIHSCHECNALSINRIAADDDVLKLSAVFDGSFRLEGTTLDLLQSFGIRLLGQADNSFIRTQLFGCEFSQPDPIYREGVFETTE